ncbi:NAD(P)-dependent oxidoreductase [Paraburkholderia caribensis]|uniref:NAD(P)-dependent oxidoreductase n=1 Tax=Paraburkholderia TaxID=1822464 RepID=UPI001CC68765|nr:NAD(P)-dependent oxidoreductase [Paraburkholderia caribensis]
MSLELAIDGHAITRLGFVGLGVMGEPMCANLLAKSGLPVCGADYDPAPLRALEERGLESLDGASAVGAHADLVFVCVANADQLDEACFGSGGLLVNGHRVRVIVDCSTTSVERTREFARRAHEFGVIWVDAPVARMREAARNGTLLFMVGADARLYESLSPLLRCMGSDIVHCGPSGSGQVVKILNNKVLIEAVHSLAEALAIARGAGVDGEVLFDALGKGSADSKALRFQGVKHLLPGDFPPRTFAAAYARKDMGLALELAGDVHVEAQCARTTAAILDEAIAAGYGADYYPVILRLIEAGANVGVKGESTA